MRLSYSLGSLLTVEQIIQCADKLSKINPDTIWIPETWGMENFSMLSAVSHQATRPKIGSSIINIYSRSPATIAMGATTVDTISKGRMVLGLGTSSLPIVQDFHGYNFEKPLTRMKEYVEIIRKIISGEKIKHQGQFFNLKGFQLLIRPTRKEIPIYLAAVNPKMVELTWSIADGVIFYLRPINELENTISKMQKTREIDVSCQIITAISENVDDAINRTKSTLAFYIAVGKVYREFLAKNGFKKETDEILTEFKNSGLESISKYVTDKMIDSLTICGTPEDGRKKLAEFRKTGITQPIIQFNPVGDVLESFDLLTKTFAGE